MADVPLEGRQPGEVGVPKEDKEAKHTKSRKEKATEPEEVNTKQGFQFVAGNFPGSVIVLLQAINNNLVALKDAINRFADKRNG